MALHCVYVINFVFKWRINLFHDIRCLNNSSYTFKQHDKANDNTGHKLIYYHLVWCRLGSGSGSDLTPFMRYI